MTDYKTISVIGDSIAQGYFDQGQTGWPSRLVTQLQASKPYGYYLRNFAVSGDQTVDCLHRLRSDVASNPGEMLLIACGVNDIIRYRDPASPPQIGVDVCHYRWTQLLTEAKRLAIPIHVIGMIPVAEDRQQFAPGDAEAYWNLNADIRAYDDLITSWCADFDISHLPLFAALAALDYPALLHDASHPNERGHAWIAAQVRAHLGDF